MAIPRTFGSDFSRTSSRGSSRGWPIDITGQTQPSPNMEAIARIFDTIDSIQQRNRQRRVQNELLTGVAAGETAQGLAQRLLDLQQPQQGGIGGALQRLNPRAISSQRSQQEQSIISTLVGQQIQPRVKTEAQQFLTRPERRQAAQVKAGLIPGAARPPSPTEQISRKKLDRINILERKLEDGTATELDKIQLQAAIGLRATKTPADRLTNWAKILDIATKPTLDAEGNLITNPLPNVASEARKQMQSALSDLQGKKAADAKKPAFLSAAQQAKQKARDAVTLTDILPSLKPEIQDKVRAAIQNGATASDILLAIDLELKGGQ